jgi:hypothetical protein
MTYETEFIDCCDNMQFERVDLDEMPLEVPCISCGKKWFPHWNRVITVDLGEDEK